MCFWIIDKHAKGGLGWVYMNEAAFRLLSRNIALALCFELENNDPLFPELLHYFDPHRKQGGDNPDALYVGSPINGSDTYRICGHRGSADFFAVTVVERGGTPWGGAVAGSEGTGRPGKSANVGATESTVRPTSSTPPPPPEE